MEERTMREICGELPRESEADEGGKTEMNECKFHDKDGNGTFYCKCLKTDICPGKACAFYITKEESNKKNAQTLKRLRSLPDIQKYYIKKKYNLSF